MYTKHIKGNEQMVSEVRSIPTGHVGMFGYVKIICGYDCVYVFVVVFFFSDKEKYAAYNNAFFFCCFFF